MENWQENNKGIEGTDIFLEISLSHLEKILNYNSASFLHKSPCREKLNL